MTTKLRASVWFRDIVVGAVFGDSGEWVKRSSRTAYHTPSGRIFYFRQLDLVRRAPD